MENTAEIRLTSTETSHLWSGYLFESLVHHMCICFVNHIQDDDIKEFYEICLTISKDHVNGITSILKQENFPIPRGITSEDINPNVPRLFSDVYMLNYVKNMAKFALTIIVIAYGESSRDDVRKLLKKHLDDLEMVDQKATELLLAKGIYSYPPFIPVPKQVDFVKKQNFLTGFFGNKRPLSAIEIRQLFHTALQNALGKAMLMGFSQVAKSKDIRNYFEKGKEISNKFYKEVTDVLNDEDISIPSTFDGEVFDTTEPPFSDRLMLLHVLILGSYGIGNYGMGLGTIHRRDLAALFARMMAESSLYSEDGANIMIENGWLEQPPLAPNREALANI
ncbi:DUF3231 family protein [Paenibacillus eucommiae]|uniref:DUF3231 family protein n=1 Tax=Paenibacillus eucommiae TaxID=1355755 RepID=A0ABS4J5S2_9BACL|nr:DUF3231 family protein [Paenibacillus eucommiae]MBP1994139.1 hypothetical protein [Paenibacillus eucommiae]